METFFEYVITETEDQYNEMNDDYDISSLFQNIHEEIIIVSLFGLIPSDYQNENYKKHKIDKAFIKFTDVSGEKISNLILKTLEQNCLCIYPGLKYLIKLFQNKEWLIEPVKLKPYELHLGHGNVIDLTGVYNYGAVHDEWQMCSDHSGEYKDIKLYTYNSKRALELINDKYAILESIENEDRYNLIMRRHY